MDQEKELPIEHKGNSWSTNQAAHIVSNQQIKDQQDLLNCTSTKLESRIRIRFVAEMLHRLHARGCVLIYSKMNTQVQVPSGSWNKGNRMSIGQIRTKQQH